MSEENQQQQQPKFVKYEQKSYPGREKPTQKAINSKKLVANMTVQQLQTYLEKAAKQQNQILQDKGIDVSPQNLIKKYYEHDPSVLAAVAAYEEAKGVGVTPYEAGIKYNQQIQIKNSLFDAENNYIADKLKFTPSRENLDIFAKEYGLPHISRKKMAELLAIDDWSSVFSEILPAVKRGAFNAIDWAHQKYVKPNLEEANYDEELQQLKRQTEVEKKRVQVAKQKQAMQDELEKYKRDLDKRNFQDDFADKDWGQVPVDQGKDPTTQMWKMARVPGQTYEQVPRNNFKFQTTDRLVDIAYVRACLCPEYYTAKSPLPGYSPCMTIQSSTNYTLSSNANGSQLVMFNPWSATAAANTGTSSSYWYCQNGTTFNTDTGAFTGLLAYDGPLLPIYQDLAQYRLQSASFTFVPTLSENNAQGSVSLAQYVTYNPTFVTANLPDSAGAVPFVTNSAMSTNSTFVSGNIRSVYRQTVLPSQPMITGQWVQISTATTTSSMPFTNSIIMTVAGAPPSTIVGKVYVYYNIEVRYRPESTRFTQQQPAMYSAPTIELLQALSNHEALFMQNANDIRPVLEQTFNKDFIPTYDNVYNLLVAHAKQAKGKSLYDTTGLPQTYVNQSNSSFLVD